MHELALIEGIINIINAEAKKNGFTRVLEIRLKIGEYSGVIPECMLEMYPLAAAGSPGEGAEIVIETVKAEFLCLDCGAKGDIDRGKACCRACGGTAVKMTAGREFYVENLKVE